LHWLGEGRRSLAAELEAGWQAGKLEGWQAGSLGGKKEHEKATLVAAWRP